MPSFFVLIGLFEKPKLDNARKIKRILFFDPDDMEFKNTMKNARMKLESATGIRHAVHVAQRHSIHETRSALRSKKWKTRWACIADAHESVRKRTSEIPQRDDGDHIAEKGFNSSFHGDHVGKPIPIHQAMKIPNAKAAFGGGLSSPRSCQLGMWKKSRV